MKQIQVFNLRDGRKKMGKKLENSDSYEEEKWYKIITNCSASGQGIKEYCDSIGVTPSSYYYHLKKAQNAKRTDPQLVPIDFVKSEEIASTININYHGAIIQIRGDDEISLCTVLSALKKL